MKRRFPKLAHWLASIYLVWSLVIYFGTLGRNGHEWWPLFLYFIIWPLSALYEVVSSVCLDWFIPTANWMWTLNDYIAGAFYIVAGDDLDLVLGTRLLDTCDALFPL